MTDRKHVEIRVRVPVADAERSVDLIAEALGIGYGVSGMPMGMTVVAPSTAAADAAEVEPPAAVGLPIPEELLAPDAPYRPPVSQRCCNDLEGRKQDAEYARNAAERITDTE